LALPEFKLVVKCLLKGTFLKI